MQSKKYLELEAISDSWSLWSALKESAGLSLSSDPEKSDYDDGIRSDLQAALFPGREGDFETLLQSSGDSIDAGILLRAFLSAIQPLSQMQFDILEMLAAASAPVGEESLRVNFDFAGEDPLTLLLSEFKEQFRQLEELVIDVPVIELEIQRFWEIFQQLKDPNSERRSPQDVSGIPTELARWIAQRADWKGPRVFEPFPIAACRTGHREVDAALLPVVELIALVINAAMRRAMHHDALAEYSAGVDPNDDPLAREDGIKSEKLWLLESDYWSASMAQVVGEVLNAANNHDLDVISILQRFEGIDLPAIGSIPTKALLERIEDILDLPVWKRRSEVYSVWVGAQIWRIFDDCEVIFHAVDGVLSFAFEGSHLATVITPEPRQVLEFWAEYRVKAPPGRLRSGERSEAIQPDYAILRAPLSAPSPARVIVEVKQYKSYSRNKFSAALIDYAAVCDKAQILLANYSPVGSSVLSSVDSDLRPRSSTFGELRPDRQEMCAEFGQKLRLALGLIGTRPPQPRYFEVVLNWEDQPSDLDLHVIYRQNTFSERIHVCYNRKDDTGQIVLSEDVKDGKGPEIVTAELTGGVMDILVHNYSDEKPLKGSKASVGLQHKQDSHKGSCTFKCPSVGTGPFWHVCKIDVGSGEVSEVGIIRNDLPPELKE